MTHNKRVKWKKLLLNGLIIIYLKNLILYLYVKMINSN